LARQEKIFGRQGIELPRSTLTDWMLAIGQATTPLVDRMDEWLKTTDILASDDTPLPWQNGCAGKTTTARLWVWRGVIDDNKPLLIYQFTPDRSGEHAAAFLKGWRGYLQADAYSGYHRNFVDGNIIEVGCLAHARRRYFEIAKSAKTPGFAHNIVQRIGELYAIERDAKERQQRPPRAISYGTNAHRRCSPPSKSGSRRTCPRCCPRDRWPKRSATRSTDDMLTKGTEYVDQGQEYYEQQYQQRVVANLQRRATALGYKLMPSASQRDYYPDGSVASIFPQHRRLHHALIARTSMFLGRTYADVATNRESIHVGISDRTVR
jgi:Transposase IS66 family